MYDHTISRGVLGMLRQRDEQIKALKARVEELEREVDLVDHYRQQAEELARRAHRPRHLSLAIADEVNRMGFDPKDAA